MGAMASQITSLPIVYSTVYSDADQRKHQSPASLAFVWGIHRGPVNSPHKWPVTQKMFPYDDVIMIQITYLAIQGGIFSSRNVHMTNESLHIHFPTYFNWTWVQHLLITKISNVIYHSWYVMKLISDWVLLIMQGKSERFDSCNGPSNFTLIGLKLSIFQLVIFFYPVWPWNLTDDLDMW